MGERCWTYVNTDLALAAATATEAGAGTNFCLVPPIQGQGVRRLTELKLEVCSTLGFPLVFVVVIVRAHEGVKPPFVTGLPSNYRFNEEEDVWEPDRPPGGIYLVNRDIVFEGLLPATNLIIQRKVFQGPVYLSAGESLAFFVQNTCFRNLDGNLSVLFESYVAWQ